MIRWPEVSDCTRWNPSVLLERHPPAHTIQIVYVVSVIVHAEDDAFFGRPPQQGASGAR